MGAYSYDEVEEDFAEIPAYTRHKGHHRLEAQGSFFGPDDMQLNWDRYQKKKKGRNEEKYHDEMKEESDINEDSPLFASPLVPESGNSDGEDSPEEVVTHENKNISNSEQTANNQKLDQLEFDSIHSVPVRSRTCDSKLALLQCVLIRRKTLLGCQLELQLESTKETLLLAKCRHRSGNYHIFHVGRGNLGTKLHKKGGNYLGKLAQAPGAQSPYQRVLLDNKHGDQASELALFIHRRTRPISALVDGAKPRQICVVFPSKLYVSADSTPNNNQSPTLQKLLHSYLIGDPTLTVLHQLEPKLVGGQYSLNFHGRARVPSVKNCQIVQTNHICDSNNEPQVLLQVGKVKNDIYNLDFSAPFTPLTAFAFAVCQFLR